MNAERAQAWWIRYFEAPDEAARNKVNIEAMPKKARGRRQSGFIAGTAHIQHA